MALRFGFSFSTNRCLKFTWIDRIIQRIIQFVLKVEVDESYES